MFDGGSLGEGDGSTSSVILVSALRDLLAYTVGHLDIKKWLIG